MHFVVQYDEWKRNRQGDMDNPPAIPEYFRTSEAAERFIARKGDKACNVKIFECEGDIPAWACDMG